MKKQNLLLLLLLLSFMPFPKAFSQQIPLEIPLYSGKIPGEIPGPDEETASNEGGRLRYSKIRKPTLSVYLPPKEKATGTAVVICPGGGYSIVAAGHEGHDVAKKFNEQGIAAFVLKYRLPDAKTSSRPDIAPLQDAQQAMLLIRERAKEWQVNPEKLGIMGFSAGGHLASTAGTHFQESSVPNAAQTNLRPDFMLLLYPVISSDKTFAHQGSFDKLLGTGATADRLNEFSNEKEVTAQTPPTFLVHASDDKAVPVKNSIVFYEALLQHEVPAELHIYQNGGHGFGLNNSTTSDAWFERALNWMKSNKF
ncbi:alpha/beta hydrolase [Pontibacter diazotrophicus]|uniref:Alpha/beta hydrolase n=1 Tax=Pontibacter diazotrophicus TaxID=1400979 RepID=A0A3D8LBN5_9BACT|nr:alpha/beta hydrolase [Pontibacter diazotrophicus]RDV14818.1 alpha/beta hydrolase [Pontibacter diazotrophicus]